VVGSVVAAAGIARLWRAHRDAEAAGRAVTAEQVALLRGAVAERSARDRARLRVQREPDGLRLALDRTAASGGAIVDPTSLPVADGRVDTARALGLLEGTLHADAVLHELRRVLRDGGIVEVDVANAAAATASRLRRDPIGLVARLRAGRGRTQLAERRLVSTAAGERRRIEVPMTHAELLGLARDMGFEPAASDLEPRRSRLLAERLHLHAVAARPPRRRPVTPWWPALLSEDGVNLDYLGPRPEVAALVPAHCASALDLGCAAGSLGMLLEERGTRVTGIEIDGRLAARAAEVLTHVVAGDLVEVLRTGRGLDRSEYDAVIAADCLEHLADPAAALRDAVSRLSSDGCVVVSLPNVRHWDTLWNLGVLGLWPQRQSGIHDRTHLRWFTRRSVVELLEGAGIEVEVITSVRRVREARSSWLDAPARLLPGALGELVTFQWLARGRRAGQRG
jgi:SAM-dependent methyltransferase